MKVVIKSNDFKFPIKLYLPLFFLKFVFKVGMRYSSDLRQYNNVSLDIFKIIKRYVKENGHFVLVDIETDENVVFIEV